MNRTQNPTGTAADTTTDLVVTPALTLRGAASYLELHGWTTGDYYARPLPVRVLPFPPADTVGALGMAAHGTVTDCPLLDGPHVQDCNRAFGYLACYLDEQGETTEPHQPGLTSVSEWNDRPGQAADNVIAILRAAADEYDWTHASEDDVETYADSCLDNDAWPTREGFLAWLAGR
jgi:hypothetical protein